MTEVTGVPPNDLGEFRKAVLRIVTFRPGGFGARGGYLLSQQRVEEIVAEAHQYASEAASAQRERIAAVVPADTLDAVADWLANAGAESDAVMGDTPARLKVLASLIREGDFGGR